MLRSLTMPTSQEEVARRWHRRLTATLAALDARQLAAHEEGLADAWQYERDTAAARIRHLEEQCPAVKP